MRLFLFSVMFLLSSFIYPVNSNKSAVLNSLETKVKKLYKFNDWNIIHIEENKIIHDEFLYLLNNYDQLTQTTKDNKSIDLFMHLYRKLDLGVIEDNLDYRRKKFRTAQIYTSISICSESNSKYFLDLATQCFFDENREPIEFIEEQFIGQILINIYIGIIKNKPDICREYIRLALDKFSYEKFLSLQMEEIYLQLLDLKKIYNFNNK